MPARHAFLPALLPVFLHRGDLAHHTREESVPHPPSLSKVDFAPPRVRVRVTCSGRFPFTLSLEGKRALCGFVLDSFRIRTCERRARNSFRIRTYKIAKLKVVFILVCQCVRVCLPD